MEGQAAGNRHNRGIANPVRQVPFKIFVHVVFGYPVEYSCSHQSLEQNLENL
jgi:hypothetical protein